MKNIVTLILALTIFSGSNLFSQTTGTPGDLALVTNASGSLSAGSLNTGIPRADLEWLMDVTRKLSPDSWHLLLQYDALAEKYSVESKGWVISMIKPAKTLAYLSPGNRISLLNRMSTNVHEIAHGFSSYNVFRLTDEKRFDYDHELVQGTFYLSTSKQWNLSFPEKSLFPAMELSAVIPNQYRTFRFNTYIQGNTSTQQEGVLGLLDEFHAYYIGSRFKMDVRPAYVEAAGCQVQGFYEWAMSFQSIAAAFFEFDYFVREYLLLMNRQSPADYHLLLSNTSFREAYGEIHRSYRTLVNEYLETVQREVKRLNAAGNDSVSLEGNVLWVQMAGSSSVSGTTYISKDMETLLPVLNSSRYREIESDFPLVFSSGAMQYSR